MKNQSFFVCIPLQTGKQLTKAGQPLFHKNDKTIKELVVTFLTLGTDYKVLKKAQTLELIFLGGGDAAWDGSVIKKGKLIIFLNLYSLHLSFLNYINF